MSAARHAVWTALRDAGPSTTDDLTAKTGAARQTVHGHLVALWRAGCVARSERRPHVYTAVSEPVVEPEPLRSIDAVRQVLAAGPVTGRAEVARRAGFNAHSVSQALAQIATRERVGHNTPTTYRLREGA